MNVQATANLVAAIPNECALVYVSTDQVYPGVPGPHEEGSASPVNTYGRTKLAGEQEAARHSEALILRTNIFGPSRSPGRESLSDFFVNSSREKRPVTLFHDILFSPLHMATLAELALDMVSNGIRGLFNVGSQDGMSKADFALAVAGHLELSTETAKLGVSTQVAERAARAADLRLDLQNIEAALRRPMPNLLEEVAKL